MDVHISLHWRENETWMKKQYTGDWNSSKFSKTSFLQKKKNMVKTSTFNVTTIHIIRGNYHPARLSRESTMYREWWFWWKTSHCNTMQKQTHYEYYYVNKLIQVYKARKSNIAFHSTQHSTIISWSSGCVQNLIKVFKSIQSFSDRGLS